MKAEAAEIGRPISNTTTILLRVREPAPSVSGEGENNLALIFVLVFSFHKGPRGRVLKFSRFVAFSNHQTRPNLTSVSGTLRHSGG